MGRQTTYTVPDKSNPPQSVVTSQGEERLGRTQPAGQQRAGKPGLTRTQQETSQNGPKGRLAGVGGEQVELHALGVKESGRAAQLGDLASATGNHTGLPRVPAVPTPAGIECGGRDREEAVRRLPSYS